MVTEARRRLIQAGFPQERVSRFPAEQVLLLDEKRGLEVRFDDAIKIVGLPVWQMEALIAQNQPPGGTRPTAGLERGLFAEFVPATYKVCRAQARLEQRIALLRHVEALRLYAAEHNGTFPAKLSEITVPLPDDPFTGKPFRYELVGRTAHLRGTPPPGLEKDPAFNVHYELTLQKTELRSQKSEAEGQKSANH
jgi:hypothetical protein